MNKNKSIKASLYLRVEPTDGTPVELLRIEESFREQEKVCRDFCQSQNIEVNEDYVYRDVCSGTLAIDSRPELQKLFRATEAAHDFDIVVVPKLDRLGRHSGLLLNALDILAQEGIGLRSATEPFDTNVGDGLIVHLLGAFAGAKRGALSKRRCECSNCF